MKTLVSGLLLILSVVNYIGLENGQAIITGRVLDAETKQLIPCTVAIRTSDGSLVIDHLSFKDGFRSGGQFEKTVPPGAVAITVNRGFDNDEEGLRNKRK